MRHIVLALAVALGALSAAGQHRHGGTTKAVEPHPGLGNYHHPITTKNPEAQTFFDQGLTLLYAFNHDEAALVEHPFKTAWKGATAQLRLEDL